MKRDWNGLETALQSICRSKAEEKLARKDCRTDRRHRIETLKKQVQNGEYQPDLRDIARLLTSAMDPRL